MKKHMRRGRRCGCKISYFIFSFMLDNIYWICYSAQKNQVLVDNGYAEDGKKGRCCVKKSGYGEMKKANSDKE